MRMKLAVFFTMIFAVTPILADGIRSDSHAPIGVMGDHIHKEGEWMVSYRYMTMDMDGNLQGDDSITADQIVTTLNNPFAPPPTVRVVPVSMTTNMHMFGVMYAINDSMTLMGMLNYVDKEMDHITYAGMMGTTQLGTFTTESSGIGDTKLSLLWGLSDNNGHKVHANLGLSLPTGSTDETGTVLTPMGMNMTMRLPYAMQLGSGTYDIEPGITYYYLGEGRVTWGAQFKAVVRLSDNDENYTLGDRTDLSFWGAYRFSNSASGGLRLSFRDEDSIDGRDMMIMAPVQTANPANYGGDRIDLGVSLNVATHSGHRFALEYETPIEQDVNGVQMEMESMLTLGYQFAF